MDFAEISKTKKEGFSGFKTVEELYDDPSYIPAAKGIYLVLADNSNPVFLKKGTGGFFKGKNPNVPIEILTANWVPTSLVLYIGKAGNVAGKATLRSRLKQYLRFGQGKNVGHWGGRYIWQLKNSQDLVICWRAEVDPRQAERSLIQTFIDQHKLLPFANLVR